MRYWLVWDIYLKPIYRRIRGDTGDQFKYINENTGEQIHHQFQSENTFKCHHYLNIKKTFLRRRNFYLWQEYLICPVLRCIPAANPCVEFKKKQFLGFMRKSAEYISCWLLWTLNVDIEDNVRVVLMLPVTCSLCVKTTILQCLITDISGGSRIFQTRAPTYYLLIFPQKLHENEEIWTGGTFHCILSPNEYHITNSTLFFFCGMWRILI